MRTEDIRGFAPSKDRTLYTKTKSGNDAIVVGKIDTGDIPLDAQQQSREGFFALQGFPLYGAIRDNRGWWASYWSSEGKSMGNGDCDIEMHPGRSKT